MTQHQSTVRSRVSVRIIIFYILAFSAGGFIQPFLNIYLLEVGLSPTEIGALLGWAAFITVVTTPLIGYLADHTQLHRQFLGAITFVKGLSAPAMLLSSAKLWLGASVTVRVLTAGASDAILTPLTFAYLRDKKNRYLGSIRFWGVAGFSVASIVAGFMAQGRSAGILFPLSAVAGTLAFLFIGVFPARISSDDIRPSISERSSSRSSFSPWFLFFVVFIFSVGLSGPETFGNVYLAEKLSAGNDLIGFLSGLLVLMHLPGNMLADRFANRFGIPMTLFIGLLSMALGWLGFAVINKPLQIIPFHMVHGMGRAFYIIGLFTLFRDISLAKRASTDLMIANVTLPGLAGMFAKPLSGLIYDRFGGQVLFSADVVVLVIVSVIFYMYSKRIQI